MTAAAIPLYLDPTRPVDERISDLLGRMTLPEKVGQMLQLDARDDLEDQVLRMHAGSILHASPERVLQRARADDRDASRHPAAGRPRTASTATPSGRGRRSSRPSSAWRPPGTRSSSSRSRGSPRSRSSATGIHWTFSPVLCIARDLRWGRVNETFGEDPFLIGELASAMVRGYQGDGLGRPDGDPRHREALRRLLRDAGRARRQRGGHLSRRKLRSWFLPPFERVGPRGLPHLHARLPVHRRRADHRQRLAARATCSSGEWGYTGTLVTDWDNVGRMVWEQQVQPDYAHAAAAAVKAGNDMVMTTPGFFEGAQDAIARGPARRGTPSTRRSRRILRLKFELGLFENPRPPDAAIVRPRSSAYRCARRSQPRRRPSLARPAAQRGRPPARRRTRLRRVRTSAARRRTARAASRSSARSPTTPQTQLGDWAGVVRAGRLDARRPSARDDRDRARRPARSRSRRLDRSTTPAEPTS